LYTFKLILTAYDGLLAQLLDQVQRSSAVCDRVGKAMAKDITVFATLRAQMLIVQQGCSVKGFGFSSGVETTG
jgi:hypothetical protein